MLVKFIGPYSEFTIPNAHNMTVKDKSMNE